MGRMNRQAWPFLLAGVVSIAAVLIPLSSSIAAQANSPEARVRTFYAWYLHELNAEHDPIANNKILRQHLTARYATAIARALKRENGIDADPFIDAQDFDPLWEKNTTVLKPTITGVKATTTVTLKGGPNFGTKRLKVGLRKEGGVWKIDSVNDRLSP